MIEFKMKRAVALLAMTLLFCGCAGQSAFRAGKDLMQEGQYDEAVVKYFQATEKDPDNKEYRVRLLEARALAAQQHLKRGRMFAAKEDFRAAAIDFEQAAALDPSVEVAASELKIARDRLHAEELVEEAEQFYRARKFTQARSSLAEAFQLRPGYVAAQALQDKIEGERKLKLDGFELDVTSAKPITLKFKDADVRDVFNILSKLSGINFIFDEEIRSQKVSVLLEDASFAQALELLLNMNKLGKKVLNSKTIIVYPKTKEKEKQYEDQLIQTFYLSSIDAKKAVNLLRTMLQLRKIYVHEELNALVIRDTPEVIKLAQQIIEAADRSDSEVVYDLEVIAVSHTNDLTIGPKLSSNAISLGLSNPGSGTIVSDALSPGSPTDNLVKSASGLQTFYTLPTATFDMLKTLSDTEILAQPKIRVKNQDKAKVHIGTREPVITVTINGDQTTENVQYVDVGVKLDVEPSIQLDNSVVTKLSLEVSSVSDRTKTDNGTQVLTITTTNAQTGLILKDGERTVLGGLIRDDSSNSRRTFPFLGDLPIIGDLITNHTRRKLKIEILLSVTPHIVKSVEIPRPDVVSIWSGGEDDLRAGQTFGAFAVPVEKEAAQSQQLAPSIPPGASPFPPVGPEVRSVEPWPPIETAPVVSQPAVPAVVPQGLPASQETVVTPEAAVPVEPPPATPVVPESSPTTTEEIVAPVLLPPLEIPPEESQVSLSGPSQVGVGDEFTVEATAAAVQNLYSAPLFINYDPQLLEFLKAEEGDFLKQQGQSTIFTTSANPATGKLIVGYKQGAGGTGASGSGTLFRLVFRAKSAGFAALGLERINFRDPAGNRLTVTATGTTVEVR